MKPGSILVPQRGSVYFTEPETVLEENLVNEQQQGNNSIFTGRSGYCFSLLVRTGTVICFLLVI